MACCEIAVSEVMFSMSSLETLPLTFDATAALLSGETIITAQAYLVQIDSGADYTAGLQGPVSISGAQLTQTVTALLPRKRYRLTIQFEVAANKTWAPYLLIECPE